MTNHFHVVAYVPDREEIGVASRSYFTNRYLSPLVASGHVEMTDPSHPRSSAQAYRLAARGRRVVA